MCVLVSGDNTAKLSCVRSSHAGRTLPSRETAFEMARESRYTQGRYMGAQHYMSIICAFFICILKYNTMLILEAFGGSAAGEHCEYIETENGQTNEPQASFCEIYWCAPGMRSREHLSRLRLRLRLCVPVH